MKIDNSILKYSIIFAGVSIGSELCYKLYKCIFASPPDIINEVLFTNNKSGCCRSKMGQMPTNQTLCSNTYCISRNLKRIIDLIDATEFTIGLSMYIFTCQELSEALIRAKKRGVIVRVIADKSMAFSSGSQLSNFPQVGIPVKFPMNTEVIMHHKFCLLDVRMPNSSGATLPNTKLPTGGVLMTGSMNWTMQALSGNWDNFIITSNKELVKQFSVEFEKMWQIFKSDVD